MREADEQIWHAYERDLRQRRVSAETVYNYRHTVEQLSGACPAGLLDATPADVQAWLAAAADRYSAASHASLFRRARTFFGWASRMEYLDGPNPMRNLRAPREDSAQVKVPDAADIAAVLAACAGKDYRDRRDLAIMRLMLETGTPRASALAALTVGQLDLRRDQVTMWDKGRKERTIPLGGKSAHALTLYLRARGKHPRAGLPQLFLGKRGAMTRDGIYQVLESRCEAAGVPVISPHKWRHFTADRWYESGGSEGDAMALFGWSSPSMAHRYAAAHAARRAQAHARELALGDTL